MSPLSDTWITARSIEFLKNQLKKENNLTAEEMLTGGDEVKGGVIFNNQGSLK